jgi:hypothetical protein
LEEEEFLMVPRAGAVPQPDHGPIAPAVEPSPEAVEFVRFCYRRRRVGWPELYDEMCAVAGRGLFRGWGADELADHGIAFGLFDMPALSALAMRVVAADRDETLRGGTAASLSGVAASA